MLPLRLCAGTPRTWLAWLALLLAGCGAADTTTITRVPAAPGDPTATAQPIQETPGDGAELISLYGVRPFGNDVTAALSVTVPANAISLTLEALGTPGSSFGLGELIGPGGRVYENLALTGAYIWVPGAEVFSTTVPNTDRPSVQLVAGGGDYTFRIRRLAGSAPSVSVRAIVETRTPVDTNVGTLDLNVWLADGIAPTAADAASDTRLQAILARMNQILGGEGIRLGAITYYDVADPGYDAVTSDAEFADLVRTTSAAADDRLNLFFVSVALGGGVVGVAATVAGPARNGTSLSGVMSVYGGFGVNTVGLIAAHEIGHFLGLFHTVEQNGRHDFIDDTADCPAQTPSTACPSIGGGLLMHWQAIGGTRITVGQGLVLRAHPLVGPRSATTTSTSRALPKPFTAADWIEVEALGRAWCGCCARPPGEGPKAR